MLGGLVLFFGAASGRIVYLQHVARRRAGFAEDSRKLRDALADFAIVNPSHLCIRAIPTSDPLEFAWCVYAPSGSYASIEYRVDDRFLGMLDSRPLFTGRPTLFRVRFEIDAEGRLFWNWSVGLEVSGQWVSDPTIGRFLRAERSRQAAQGEVVEMAIGNHVVLLEVSLDRHNGRQSTFVVEVNYRR